MGKIIGIVGVINEGTIENCVVTNDIQFNSTQVRMSGKLIPIMVGGVTGYIKGQGSVIGCKSNANVTIRGDVGGMDMAELNAGGIYGYLKEGKIENCSASKAVTAQLTGELATNKQCEAGGIVGRMDTNSNINSCISTATVSASDADHVVAGGLAGYVRLRQEGAIAITKSYASGQVKATGAVRQNSVGGFIGQLEGGIIVECWSGGIVTAVGNPQLINAIGGFVGACYEEYGKTLVQNCYTIASVSCSQSSGVIGGFAGRANGTFENCYSAGGGDAIPIISEKGNSETILKNCGALLNTSEGVSMILNSKNGAMQESQLSDGDVKKKETYTAIGWDFENVWVMPTSGSYKLPILRNADQNVQAANPQPVQVH